MTVSSHQVHTKLLIHRWHELLVLTTCAYRAIHCSTGQTPSHISNLNEIVDSEISEQVCLSQMEVKHLLFSQ